MRGLQGNSQCKLHGESHGCENSTGCMPTACEAIRPAAHYELCRLAKIAMASHSNSVIDKNRLLNAA